MMQNHDPKYVKRMEAERIYLRPLIRSDAEDVYHAIDISRKELKPWMFWEPDTKSPEDTLTYIKRTQVLRRKRINYDFGMFDMSSCQYLGGLGIAGISALHRFGELGYWVRTDRHREKIAYTASVMMLRFAFEIIKLHKVRSRANVANTVSINLQRKLGFRQEGVSRDDLYVNGKWGDHVYVGMLEDEYAKYKKNFDREVPWRIIY